jgi:hypothetical protein
LRVAAHHAESTFGREFRYSESFWATIKVEFYHGCLWPTRATSGEDIDHLEPSDLGLLETQDVEFYDGCLWPTRATSGEDIDHLEPSDLGLLETQDVEFFGDRAVLVIALSDGHMSNLPAPRHVFQLFT